VAVDHVVRLGALDAGAPLLREAAAFHASSKQEVRTNWKVSVCLRMYVYMCVCVCMYLCVYVCVCMCVRVRVCVYV
jgi:hypothetical protein